MKKNTSPTAHGELMPLTVRIQLPAKLHELFECVSKIRRQSVDTLASEWIVAGLQSEVDAIGDTFQDAFGDAIERARAEHLTAS